jgi:hypothetical protein
MSETLKSQVLAKCGEAKQGKIQWVGFDGREFPLEMFEHVGGRKYLQIGGTQYVVTLKFSEDTSADSFVWPLAAKILGIAKPEPRPSDGMLWEAWWASAKNWGAEHVLESEVRPMFQEWLATIPPDPLADDRELVGNSLRAGYIRVGTEGQQITFEFAVKVCAAIKRLAGMEVNNG